MITIPHGADETNLDFEGIKEILEYAIKDLDQKIRSGRIRDEKKEELRIKSLRTLAYLCKTYSSILESQKVEEIENKIEILEGKLKKDDTNAKSNRR